MPRLGLDLLRGGRGGRRAGAPTRLRELPPYLRRDVGLPPAPDVPPPPFHLPL